MRCQPSASLGSVLIWNQDGFPEENGRAAIPPWLADPFRLISWLDMNKFSAEAFFKIGCLLGNTIQALNVPPEVASFPDLTVQALFGWIKTIDSECKKIGLVESSKAAARLCVEFTGMDRPSKDDVRVKIDSLQKLIGSEMESQLFLWVPGYRAEWHSKDAEAILGTECCKRFKSIQIEIEEAAKCYALGRYTASAFHLMRSTEAGVKALARAIGYTPPHNQWDLVFKQMQREFALKPSQRPPHWQTHGDFLETIWADLRAVSKAWRNDVAHLVDVYSEEEAKNLLTVIPIFLRELATKMDENGKLY